MRSSLILAKHDELLSMQAICRFKLASALPVHGKASYSDIARKAGISELNARRFIRHAITKHIFDESTPGVVTHNATSRLLAEDSQIMDWVGASTDELWQSAAQTINAMSSFPNSQEPNETVCTVIPGRISRTW